VYPLNPEVWTKEALLYVVVNFRKVSAGRFDYANKFNRAIAVELQISLPVTDSGEIDFDYMTERIRELESYLKVTGLSSYMSVLTTYRTLPCGEWAG